MRSPYHSTLKMLLTLAFLISIPLLLSTVFANAQSFSCAQAQNSAQFAVCNNEELLGLDEKLAAIYYHQKSELPTAPQRQQISREHGVWEQKRNLCKLDWTCLKIRYKERINQLIFKL